MSPDKITSFDGDLDIPVLNRVIEVLDSGKVSYKYFDVIPTAGSLNKGQIGFYQSRVYWKTVDDQLKYVNGL